jgi:CCR4-NOT transcription complex subunit 9
MTDQLSNVSKPEINREQEISSIIGWVDQLKDLSLRENALAELNKKRENYPELAVFLWFSPGTTVALYVSH